MGGVKNGGAWSTTPSRAENGENESKKVRGQNEEDEDEADEGRSQSGGGSQGDTAKVMNEGGDDNGARAEGSSREGRR